MAINRDRKNVTALDLYWAELAAGDPEAETVRQVCERAGVSSCGHPAVRPSATRRTLVIDSRAELDISGVGGARCTDLRRGHLVVVWKRPVGLVSLWRQTVSRFEVHLQ